MNSMAAERAVADEFIFGNQLLHGRFRTAIDLLAQLMARMPRPCSLTELADATSQPPSVVEVLLVSMCDAGCVMRDPSAGSGWRCAPALGTMTLADVFRSVACIDAERDMPSQANQDGAPAAIPVSRTRQSVDLLLMQATMTVNQVILQQLQAFDLGRLMRATATDSFRGHALRAVFSTRR